MKKRSIIHTLIYFLIILIEALPYLLFFKIKDAASIGIIGAADGPTAIYIARKIFGIFFFPTIILSCILLLLTIITIFKDSKKLKILIMVLSIITILTSLFSISNHLSLITIFFATIFILLAVQIILYWKEIKQASNNPDFQI